jgi:GntR family transcriptional regulator/MocR family aminotransferase
MHIEFVGLSIDKSSEEAVYSQISRYIIDLLRNGRLQAAEQLPSTRQLAESLAVHRKTVIRAYDELTAQGWLESITGSGTFAARHLPELKPQQLHKGGSEGNDPAKHAGFRLDSFPHLDAEFTEPTAKYHLDDGFPDVRLAPLADLSRAYRSQLLTGDRYTRLGYTDPKGSLWLREELAAYLKETRGLHIGTDNILITRGTVMGMHLTCAGILKKDDLVVTGESGWSNAEANMLQAGAGIVRIPVDLYGLQVDELEKLCQKKSVRMVYITSHHHYPTTVALRADRRIMLLRLAEKYGFIIFEDDYDYDFHYQNKPLMPLASADQHGMVIYCGSFTKTISPAFRVGYLVAPANVITHLSKLRRIIDRQGDHMLENAVAELLQGGIIQRHLRKSLRVYRQRRDLFCKLLQTELPDRLSFEIPDGGMAVWTVFDKRINLADLSSKAFKHDLYFSNGMSHHRNYTNGMDQKLREQGTRLGFASSTEAELWRCIEIMVKLIK